jgi:ATP-binding cassette subfamily B (MDR/TAP) protein 1
MHADAVDVMLMLLGLLGAISDGMATPLMMTIVVGRVYDAAGSGPADHVQQFSSKMNEVYKDSLCLGTPVVK